MEYIKIYTEANYIYSIPPFIAIEAFQYDLDEALDSAIKRNNMKDRKGQILDSVYEPWKNTAIPEIQAKYKKGVSVSKIVSDYQFLRSWSAIWYRPINASWVKNIGKEHKSKYKNKKLSIKKIINLTRARGKGRFFIELAPYMIFLKDWRDDVRRKQIFDWTFLFEKIAKEYKIAYKDLGYLTLDEIKKGLEDEKFNIELIKKRKINPFVVARGRGKKLKIEIYSGKDIEKYKKLIGQENDQNKIESFPGLSAQNGTAKGKVKVVKTFHDIKHVKKGNILVANTTHPNYLLAMKIAAAFVTNEGGIISHAAIVSRELKKPCIVGTKIATQVLRDGDLVEVDAERGIVRILKHHGKV